MANVYSLFRGVPNTEPLTTLNESVTTIIGIVGASSAEMKRRREAGKQSLHEAEDTRNQWNDFVTEQKSNLADQKKRLRILKKLGAPTSPGKGTKEIATYTELVEQTTGAITDLQGKMKGYRKSLRRCISLCKEISATRVEAYERQMSILIPINFIYLVTVWDAFILDTARAILRVNPQLITTSEDTVPINRADLWHLNSSQDIREYLIESEINRLDHDRKKLVKCFGDYWGINWGDAGIPLDNIIEIRARRDIWVHNRGMVNNQYINMVSGNTSLKVGQIASIGDDYFVTSTALLLTLAAHIHKVAHKKHYSSTA